MKIMSVYEGSFSKDQKVYKLHKKTLQLYYREVFLSYPFYFGFVMTFARNSFGVKPTIFLNTLLKYFSF